MIPQIIHYCWFGQKPLPSLAQKCIASWKKFLPNYEIKEWNESNFDVNIIPYTHEAYCARKYAFVSDYVRFWVLYKYGGLYFDTDVEIIKPLDDIVLKGPFMGCERNGNLIGVNPGLGLGVSPALDLYKEILDMYATLHFISFEGKLNLTTIVQYTTNILIRHGLERKDSIQNVAGVWIYPQEYFCPIHVENNRKVVKITSHTYTIHHWAASWQPKSKEIIAQVKWLLMRLLGTNTILFLIDKLHLQEIRKKIGL